MKPQIIWTIANEDTKMNMHSNYIGGAWTLAARSIDVFNPSDGRKLAEIPRSGAAEVDAAVKAAQIALDGEWGKLTAAARGRLLLRLSQLITRDAAVLAQLESDDVGKPVSQARSDATACARYFEYYAGAADKVHGETIPSLNDHLVMTVYEPLGVTAHIVPWNYPLQIMGRSVAPALAMGNAIVLKPAEDTPLTAIALARLAEEAGFPQGAFNVVTGLGEEAGAALTAHPGVSHISFTGSREVGMLVQAAAAKNTIPVTLELGGKSPQIVFADAPLAEAATSIVKAISQNAGQTCSAGSRVLIEDSIYDSFTAELAKRFRALRVGAGADDLDVGPLVNAKQKSRVEAYIALGRKDGLDILAETEIASHTDNAGFFVRPTLIGDVPAEHRLAQEEIFGPVLVAIRIKSEEDAIAIANGTPYGLAAGVWTADMGRGLRLAKRIKSGQVFINNYGAGGGVEMPFGGVKASGHGREKGFEALYGFASMKMIAIKHGG
jgi:aldehyde dehydrogenase (NAD+)